MRVFSVEVARSGRALVLGLSGELDHESVVQFHEASDTAVTEASGTGVTGPSGTGPAAVVTAATSDADADTTGAGTPPLVVADCSRLLFCDSSGIGAFVRLYQRLLPHGVALRVAAPPPSVRRAFSLTGLDGPIPVHPTVDEALVRTVGHDLLDDLPAGTRPRTAGEGRRG
ncbi:STAS domain-containing protein [Streptomyces sp. NPDC096152]|uniref:STAS domain-containing protein n=1 Tax=Streptomyces sp. NPDC096152 TaxID=3366078 RepID=UPI00382F8075